MYAYGRFILMDGKKPSQYCKITIIQLNKQINVMLKKTASWERSILGQV